jgi:hypothetical protein
MTRKSQKNNVHACYFRNKCSLYNAWFLYLIIPAAKNTRSCIFVAGALNKVHRQMYITRCKKHIIQFLSTSPSSLHRSKPLRQHLLNISLRPLVLIPNKHLLLFRSHPSLTRTSLLHNPRSRQQILNLILPQNLQSLLPLQLYTRLLRPMVPSSLQFSRSCFLKSLADTQVSFVELKEIDISSKIR